MASNSFMLVFSFTTTCHKAPADVSTNIIRPLSFQSSILEA
jgi:hypothetical protein